MTSYPPPEELEGGDVTHSKDLFENIQGDEGKKFKQILKIDIQPLSM